jgi:hypothetical protein
MIYTQKEIYDYLLANPLGIDVSVGDVKNLNGGDYLFLDFTNDELIGSDNRGCYQSYIQVTVATRDFEDRKTLVNYVKDFLNVSVMYEKAIDFEYFVARCTCGVLIHETN